MSIRISEIFYSIQGESLNAGRPCTFIRVSGCNLRCVYCDTTYAYEGGTPMDISEIERRVSAFGCPLVEVTGGEPLLQPDVPLLISRLLSSGFEVILETNGSRDIGRVDRRCVKIMDMKCPGSGESASFERKNLGRLTAEDQIKFVIGDRPDYAFAKQAVSELPNALPRHHVLFSPVYGKLKPDELAAWILEDHLQARVHLQIHKILWPERARGV